jgi:hypothetical protein
VQVPRTNFRKKRRGTLFRKLDDIVKLRSGNCNYSFRVKLIGFERLCEVFNEVIIGEEATDNKATQPRNVTLQKFKKKEFKNIAHLSRLNNVHKKCKKHFYKNAERIVRDYEAEEDLLGINTVFGNYSFNYDKIALFK